MKLALNETNLGHSKSKFNSPFLILCFSVCVYKLLEEKQVGPTFVLFNLSP